MTMDRAQSRAPVLVDLALQGGGSHGAFTWGVLDRLLEERWLKIEAISGTSAGAMNGAVLGQRLHARRARRGLALPSMLIGPAWPKPQSSVRFSARRLIGC